jgi:hypothetical protein
MSEENVQDFRQSCGCRNTPLCRCQLEFDLSGFSLDSVQLTTYRSTNVGFDGEILQTFSIHSSDDSACLMGCDGLLVGDCSDDLSVCQDSIELTSMMSVSSTLVVNAVSSVETHCDRFRDEYFAFLYAKILIVNVDYSFSPTPSPSMLTAKHEDMHNKAGLSIDQRQHSRSINHIINFFQFVFVLVVAGCSDIVDQFAAAIQNCTDANLSDMEYCTSECFATLQEYVNMLRVGKCVVPASVTVLRLRYQSACKGKSRTFFHMSRFLVSLTSILLFQY